MVAPQDVARSVGSEVALARRESPTHGDRFVGLARALVHEMPVTMEALTAGVCGERHTIALAQVTAVLSREHRAEVDRRVGPLLGRLGVSGAERAARRVAAELDAAAVVARMEAAVRSRRVTVRPAPDGMAYLSVLGPLVEVVGAHAALQAHARSIVGGQRPDELPEGRGIGAVAADTALRLLSGRRPGRVQPVEVHLVMTDRSLLGTGNPERSVMEPVRVPGHGSLPAPVARTWLRGPVVASSPTELSGRPPGPGSPASVWLRRLYTTPDGRDLVAMDSRRRVFTGLLRRMLVLRDDVCVTPWCEALIAHADHASPARDGGPTSLANGDGRCARCNHTKEAPGWAALVDLPDDERLGRRDGRVRTGRSRRQRELVTPLGRRYRSEPPPLLGWGSTVPPPPPANGPSPESSRRGSAHPGRRPLTRRRLAPSRRPANRRLRLRSHLERELCRLLR